MSSQESLELLGLTQHEAIVYDALLQVEHARVRELAELVRLPRQHIYVALDRLTRKGVVACADNGIRSYSAVQPEIVFSRVIERDRELMATKVKTLKDLNRRYANRMSPDRKPEVIETIRGGRSALEEQVRRLKRTRKELLALYHSEGVGTTRRTVAGMDDLEINMLKQGLTIKCVYKRSALSGKQDRQRIRKLCEAGEQGRVVKDLPMTLQIIDNKTAVFSLRSVPEGGVGYFVNDPLIIQLYRAAFDYYWERGEPLEKYLDRFKD